MMYTHFQCDAGYHVLIPFVDVPRRVIWRTFVSYPASFLSSSLLTKVPPAFTRKASLTIWPMQQIITRDNVTISVHPMMLVKVTDPVRVAYEVRSLDSFSLDLRPHGGG